MKLLQVERERRGWSRAELARRSNLNAVTVGQSEAGRLVPYPSQLLKLAQALGLPDSQAAELVDDVPQAALTQTGI